MAVRVGDTGKLGPTRYRDVVLTASKLVSKSCRKTEVVGLLHEQSLLKREVVSHDAL
jgi:hypothetical protein